MDMIYTVTFNPAIDYVVQLDRELQLGAINRNRAEYVQFGGKGINVSGVLHTLGQDTVALGFIAGFTGDGLEKGRGTASGCVGAACGLFRRIRR